MVEEWRHIRYLIGEAILRLDDEIYLTLDPKEQQGELQSIAPL